MGGGDVDGTTPGCLDGDTGEAREQPAEALGCPCDRSRILVHLGADPAQPGSPPPAAAERDATIGRGPEVVNGRAAVGDALATGPPEFRQPFGRWSGQDDVAPPIDQR